MGRLILLTALTAFALSVVAPASAQQAGGVALAPEVLSTPGAAEQIRDRAFARLLVMQQIQQLRAGLPAGVAADPNGVNPSLDRSSVNQQTLARVPSRGDAGFLAGFVGGEPLAASRARPVTVAPTLIDQSQTLVLNTVGSPVSIGNGNLVQQQVANSTALGRGATATAAAVSGGKSTGAAHQTANSTALSLGGVAGATAANSSTQPR